MRDKEICQKCGETHYCDEHHVLPKTIFGKGKVIFLCKNCHYEFHRFLGFKFLKKENKQDEDFYLKKYAIWIASLLVIGIFIYTFL